jgi:hypothetical protein
MRNVLWLGILGLAACAGGDDGDDGGDDTEVAGDTEPGDSDTNDGGGDTDPAGGGDTEVVEEDVFAGTWGGAMVVRLHTVGNLGGNPIDRTEKCDPGSLTLTVDRSASPDLAYVSHACTEVDLGTVTLTGDVQTGPGGAPLWSDGEVGVNGSIASSKLGGGEAVTWVGAFRDTDADEVPDRLVVQIPDTLVAAGATDQGGYQVFLSVDVGLTRTGPLP